jgi:hypothetical protein
VRTLVGGSTYTYRRLDEGETHPYDTVGAQYDRVTNTGEHERVEYENRGPHEDHREEPHPQDPRDQELERNP